MEDLGVVTYKEWFGEHYVLSREFKLDFGQCDINGRISHTELLSISSDTAVVDYHRRGMTVPVLAEHGIIILVSRLMFEFHSYPLASEKLLIKTWEERPDGILLSRNYEIENEAGDVLISGTSRWLLANPDTRRILKPSVLLPLRPAPDFVIPVDCPLCPKIHRPDGMKPVLERKVMFSDIDSNGHTHNSRYAAFALDALPKEFQEGDVKSISINFAKESHLGDVISISTAFSPDGKSATVAGDVDGHACFEEVITLK